MTDIWRVALVSGLGAALFGCLLGLVTVNGLREAPLPAVPIYPRAAGVTNPVYAGDTPDCAGCTTYDEGYRWASTQGVNTADACFADDWAYQRGCLAFVQGGRPY